MQVYRESKSPRRRGFRPSVAVMWVIACVVLWSVAAMSSLSLHGNHRDKYPAQTVPYTVESGDTLWNIVADHGWDKHADIRTVIYRVMKMNNMNDAQLQPGETILIPVDGR